MAQVKPVSAERYLLGALLALCLVGIAYLAAAFLWAESSALHLRSPSLATSEQEQRGVVLWIASTAALSGVGLSVGVLWRRAVGRLRAWVLLCAVASALPVVLVLGLFYGPFDWLVFDETILAIAFLFGGMLALAAPVAASARLPVLLCSSCWGVLVLAAGTWAILFVE